MAPVSIFLPKEQNPFDAGGKIEFWHVANRVVVEDRRTPVDEVAGAESNHVVNAHEHLQSFSVVPKLLDAMAISGVTKTIIVGSPEATILKGRVGFHGEEKYNLETLVTADRYPEKFIPFPTVNPADNAKLDKLKLYLRSGAQGLKLYSGHSQFYELPLDHPSMFPVYGLCEREHLPILFHVNTGSYRDEFERVLWAFPDLKVICPHLCSSTKDTQRFEQLMTEHPTLRTDISIGHIEFLKAALQRFSSAPDKYRELFVKYQDRILFGTDTVITDARYKTVEWLVMMTTVYRNLLEKRTFTFPPLGRELNGMCLSRDILTKIYTSNFEEFMKL